MAHQKIVIVDMGSQYTQLIARRVREQSVFCEIAPPTIKTIPEETIGFVLSGGPHSVYEESAPRLPRSLAREIEQKKIPVLGICYGMQYLCHERGCGVRRARKREYGRAKLHVTLPDQLFHDLPREFTVWMSHGDQVEDLSGDWEVLARTETCPAAAVRHKSLPLFGVQFHPEVVHTENGEKIIRNFLYRVCGAKGDWRMGDFVREKVEEIARQVGEGRVVLGLSGGVDSSVTALLVGRAVGERLTCVFVDTGLLRKNEPQEVVATFRGRVNLVAVDASERFLAALKGVRDPEQKRRIIGHLFVEVFEEEARKVGADFLAQGTLYPDVIESAGGFGGPTARIKSHHNVGGLPERLNLRLIEPLRLLLKDEVREVGKILGLPENLIWRHPFPGPGLAVRIIGEVTREKLAILREADAIFIEEIKRAGLYRKIWQAFCVLLDVRTVGVMGDERTYEHVVALRAVDSTDGMTADWFHIPHDILDRVARRIVREVAGINRVVYDVTSKPPATIEWE